MYRLYRPLLCLDVLMLTLSFVSQDDKQVLNTCALVCTVTRKYVQRRGFEEVVVSDRNLARFEECVSFNAAIAGYVKSVTFFFRDAQCIRLFSSLTTLLVNLRILSLRCVLAVIFDPELEMLVSAVSSVVERPEFEKLDVWLRGPTVYRFLHLSKLQEVKIIRPEAPFRGDADPPVLLPRVRVLSILNTGHPFPVLVPRWIEASGIEVLRLEFDNRSTGLPFLPLGWINSYVMPAASSLTELIYSPIPCELARPGLRTDSLDLSSLPNLKLFNLKVVKKDSGRALLPNRCVPFARYLFGRAVGHRQLSRIVIDMNIWRLTKEERVRTIARELDRVLPEHVFQSELSLCLRFHHMMRAPRTSVVQQITCDMLPVLRATTNLSVEYLLEMAGRRR